MKKTIKEYLLDWIKYYNVLIVTNKSRESASEIWDNWEKDGVKRPDIDSIADNISNSDNLFFKELTSISSEIINRELNISYLAFITLGYDFAAVTAADGYIVLVDDAFFSLTFFIICAAYTIAQTEISEATKELIRREIREVAVIGYKEKEFITFNDMPNLFQLLGEGYNNAEASNYLFNSVRIFILGHEIGHHVFEHENGSEHVRYAIGGREIDFKIDKRSWADEFEADDFGYQVFLGALDTTKERPQTYLEFRFPFAPLVFFEICDRIDWMKKAQKVRNSSTHPSFEQRKETLVKKYSIDTQDPLYLEIEKALDFLLDSHNG